MKSIILVFMSIIILFATKPKLGLEIPHYVIASIIILMAAVSLATDLKQIIKKIRAFSRSNGC